jgi:uncharacterized protein DUF2840
VNPLDNVRCCGVACPARSLSGQRRHRQAVGAGYANDETALCPKCDPTNVRRSRSFHHLSLRNLEHEVTDLTTVELLWLGKRIENRIRFGRAVAEQIIDRHRRILSFAPGTVFAFVRWASPDFGVVISRIDILRAVTPGQRYSTVPWVKPGGEILLRLIGWPKVERVLELIDVVEALNIHPADVAPDYWHHVHNRLSVNETPRPYTHARHEAWLRRRRIAP